MAQSHGPAPPERVVVHIPGPGKDPNSKYSVY